MTGQLQEQIGALFDRSDLSLAVAESLTGGELSARFAAAPGAAGWFRGGLVAYASAVKHELLDVPPGPVVSAAAAGAMAAGVCRLLHADVAVAVTGVAGPDEQDGQPPGTVWFALSVEGTTMTRLEQLQGTPEEIVDATCVSALRWVLEHFETRDDAA
jgi:nicotinamide-nucleotide amidase